MIKRTLYFGNPCYLSRRQNQLSIELADNVKKMVPIEDVSMGCLDCYQIEIINTALEAVAVIGL